jgi:hypothetical protein
VIRFRLEQSGEPLLERSGGGGGVGSDRIGHGVARPEWKPAGRSAIMDRPAGLVNRRIRGRGKHKARACGGIRR